MFVVFQLVAAGSERVVLDLAKGLNPDQFEIYLTAFNGGVLEAPLREVCKDIFFVQKSKRFDLSAMLQIAKIVRDNRIDVVNAHHYMPCFYSFLGTRILNQKKLIYTEHSVPEVEKVASGIHRKIFNRMLFRMNAVVGISGEITVRFKELYPRHADKFHEILNGVDIEKFQQREARDDTRNHWGLSNDHFVVGMVANFRKVKNHACLVRATARLKDDYPKLRLLLVGTGFPGDPENTEKEVRELIRELGLQDRAILAGYQENIPEMLSAFDMFCLPSFSEGLPVSLLEAMAAGVPVIGSRVRGIVEVVKDEISGLLFDSNDDFMLAEGLSKMIDDPGFSKQIAVQAFDFVKSKHGLNNWLKSTSNLLTSPDTN